MKYVIVRLLSRSEISPLEKKEYMDSLYDNYNYQYVEGKRFLGFLTKFSNALGFKPYNTAKFNGEYFKTPNETLSQSIYGYPFGNVICDFFIEKGTTVAADKSYSYDNEEIAHKWVAFLRKVFPELTVELAEADVKPSREVWLTSYVFKSMDSYPITVECSLDAMPTKEEIQAVESVIRLFEHFPLKFKVLAFFCKTCEENNPEYPIHFEVEYWHNEEKRKQNDLEYRGVYNGRTCFFCTESILEDQDSDTCVDCKEKLEGKVLLEIN